MSPIYHKYKLFTTDITYLPSTSPIYHRYHLFTTYVTYLPPILPLSSVTGEKRSFVGKKLPLEIFNHVKIIDITDGPTINHR